ncbi:MAG: DNA translocase FtsK, partial [Prevotella sp.]|nr:DNA translocase FtsK [Prevotella sp.]
MGLFDLFKKKKTVVEIENATSENNSSPEEIEENSSQEEFILIKPISAEESISVEQIPAKEEIPDENFDCSELGIYDPTMDLSGYEYPSFPLLTKTEMNIDAEQSIDSSRIIEILNSFGVKIKSIHVNIGAIITLFEIVPELGVKISALRRLEEDIAISLSTAGVNIVPIPERGTIGIVIPNKNPQILSLESVLNTVEFRESRHELPVVIGKTMTNDVFVFDLCQMPHLLVAGATGQGKSVGLNVMIASFLYKKHPAELKLVLIDPRIVEFNTYLPIQNHFLAKLPSASKPVISSIEDTINTINSLVKEMDDRYDSLAKSNARDIKEYNEKFVNRKLNPLKGHKYMPYIVIIIDEFADLLIPNDNRLELVLDRLASKAHTVGMHLIISTQRPSAKVITGSIKANFPARLAFKVASSTDSRIILDEQGAEQLTGRGDALFSYGGKTTRIQVAFAGTKEVE